jgi:hypothetical protein
LLVASRGPIFSASCSMSSTASRASKVGVGVRVGLGETLGVDLAVDVGGAGVEGPGAAVVAEAFDTDGPGVTAGSGDSVGCAAVQPASARPIETIDSKPAITGPARRIIQ